eukprot:TRINITY_DN11690_c0_g1_i1.p1 TRINITY_DN11690_c0_g1~~TRINITY_DN11690_c0_g1_i1.p1  ORF type:complete len:990 (-),score=186.46 TRINITY_DN11690_c0_g1_i1:18-2987(-)
MIIFTHIDKVTNYKERCNQFQSKIFLKCPQVKISFFPINLIDSDQKSFMKLRSSVQEEILRFRLLSTENTVGSMHLEDILGQYRSQLPIPIINKGEYIRFAKAAGIPSKKIHKVLQMLSDKGSVVSFSGDFQLNDIIIIDPSWLTYIISKFYESKALSNKGVIFPDELSAIFFDLPKSLYDYIIILLQKFKIVYDMTDLTLQDDLTMDDSFLSLKKNIRYSCNKQRKNISLVPSLLPSKRPSKYLKKFIEDTEYNCYTRFFSFEWNPQFILSRMTIKLLSMGTFFKYLWLTGLFFSVGEYDNTLLELDENNFTISLTVWYDKNYPIVGTTIFSNIVNEMSVQCKQAMVPVNEFGIFKDKKIDISSITNEIFSGNPSCTAFEFDMITVAPDLVVDPSACDILNYPSLQILEKVGEGGYANVFKGTLEENTVAVKELFNTVIETYKDFRHEVVILSSLDHPSIVKIFGLTINPFTLVMEFAEEGDLLSIIMNYDIYLSWHLMKKLCTDIALGISYLHDRVVPIAHRDIKSPNILISSLDAQSDSCAKITDFGTAQHVIGPLTGRVVDNPIWLAPEILNDRPYDHTVDTYAFGVVVWEIFCRSRPFSEIQFMSDVQSVIIAGERPDIPLYVPIEVKEIIQRCWSSEPSERPEWDQILKKLGSIDADFLEEDIGPSLRSYWKLLSLQTKNEKKTTEWNSHVDIVANWKMQSNIKNPTKYHENNLQLAYPNVYEKWKSSYFHSNNADSLRFYLEVILYNNIDEEKKEYHYNFIEKHFLSENSMYTPLLGSSTVSVDKDFSHLMSLIEERLIHDIEAYISYVSPSESGIGSDLGLSELCMLANQELHTYLDSKYVPEVYLDTMILFHQFRNEEFDKKFDLFKSKCLELINHLTNNLYYFQVLGVKDRDLEQLEKIFEDNWTIDYDIFSRIENALLFYFSPHCEEFMKSKGKGSLSVWNTGIKNQRRRQISSQKSLGLARKNFLMQRKKSVVENVL